MKSFTYEEIEDRVREDLDLEDEGNFVKTNEMAAYANEAIDFIESQVLKINEDYLLSSATITLIANQQQYDLPSNIYAQKIRQVIYKNGERIYPILRIRDPHKFYQKEEIDYFGTGEMEYLYMLESVEEAQDKISFTPIPKEAGPFVKMWYIRNAKRIPMVGEGGATRNQQLATILDIPESFQFVVDYMKMCCIDKEKDPERFARQADKVKTKKEDLVAALTDRTPDNQNEIPGDMTFYVEMN